MWNLCLKWLMYFDSNISFIVCCSLWFHDVTAVFKIPSHRRIRRNWDFDLEFSCWSKACRIYFGSILCWSCISSVHFRRKHCMWLRFWSWTRHDSFISSNNRSCTSPRCYSTLTSYESQFLLHSRCTPLVDTINSLYRVFHWIPVSRVHLHWATTKTIRRVGRFTDKH